MKNKKIWILLAIFGIVFSGWFATKLWAEKDNIYESLKLFARVFALVKRNYVTEVTADELIENALKGMLERLDPYSTYLNKKEYSNLQVSTTGKFGGLGITIGIRDEVLTIIAPLEGTPAWRAGLQAGDKIIEIDGESTEGITIDEAVSKLRGDPGTKVTIKILREGVPDPFKVTITREIIKINAVPYYEMLTENIGYIRFSGFSETAYDEVIEALDYLFDKGAKKIILDIRGNPGGLLREAVEVTDIFLPPGKTIVVTKGRTPASYREFHSLRNAVKGTQYPLIVLVDHGSASASEILAGALQDWERALILGSDTTFGKGSVQTIHRIFETQGAVKLTTAYWYTPSGRCIDIHKVKKERKKRGKGRKEEEAKFYTLGKHHRLLKGEGGIIPDIIVEVETPPVIVVKLITKGAFFKYAVKYSHRHKILPADFVVTDELLNDFKVFLKREKILKFDERTEREFEFAKEEIKHKLEQEIVSKYEGLSGAYRVVLKYDTLVKKAIEILEKAENVDDLFKEI